MPHVMLLKVLVIYTMTIMSKWAGDGTWNEWRNLKCPQKPTKQIDIDGGLFSDTVLNK